MVLVAAVEVRYAPKDEGEAARRWRRGGQVQAKRSRKRRWKRLDERFRLGASKDTGGDRAHAKVPRLDLLMKPLRLAGPSATRGVAGSRREPAALPGHAGS